MATKAGSKKKAPMRRAQRWYSEIPGIMGRMAVLTVAVVILGLMFSGIQGLTSGWLRIGLSLLIGGGIVLFYYGDGLNKGAADANSSVHFAKLEKDGKTITAQEDASCYHPLKGVCGALALFAIPLALAAYVALNAQAYTYTLQDLPNWLTASYGDRQDVMGALGAYTAQTGMSATAWIRVFVRLLSMIFLNLFEDTQRMALLIDRCVPAFIALYPLAYVIGYLRGPSANFRLLAQNKKAKKVAVRKQQKSNLTAELLGESQVPHYGHKKESEKPRKKELI